MTHKNLQDPIVFGDLREREAAERHKLEDRRQLLLDISSTKDGIVRKRSLTREETAELQEIERKLATDDVVDPLFKIAQSLAPKVGDHKQGLLPSQQELQAIRTLASGKNNDPKNWSALLDMVGLSDFSEASSLAHSLANDSPDEQTLKLLAKLFDDYVGALRGATRSKAIKVEGRHAGKASGATGAKDIDLDAFGSIINTATKSNFAKQLARAVREGLVFPAESLVDWLNALPQDIDREQQTSGRPRTTGLTEDEKIVAAVFGILEDDRQEPPAYHLQGFEPAFAPGDARRRDQFGKALFAAQGEYSTNRSLFDAVLPILVNLGAQGPQDEVKAIEWAQVVRYLIKRGVSAREPQLGRRVDEALNSVQNVGEDLPPSLIGIDLPDLEEDGTTDNAIIEDNVRALQPAYFAAMFEELKAFQVVDKLVELFQNGILPISKGTAGNRLFKYWKETATRVSEPERRRFYALTLGFVGGDDNAAPNREFNDLWMRFVSGVSSFIRQNNVDELLRTKYPGAISQQQVRKAGRDLAANLSLHGYGMAYCMATELQKQVKDVIALLSDDGIKNAYGARDMWQVIDQVSTLELGGPKNSVRYRTMAASGAIIIAWLAKKSRQLSSTGFDPILNMDEIRNPGPRPSGSKPTTDPTDFDLVNACEQWLAVTGTQEEQVEGYSQPKEAPNMTSKPIQIPAIARDMLESVGVPAMGMSNGHNRR